MKRPSAASIKTYDVVETAIDLSRGRRGTWEGIVRRRGARPWAAEVKTPDREAVPSRQDEPPTCPEPEAHP